MRKENIRLILMCTLLTLVLTSAICTVAMPYACFNDDHDDDCFWWFRFRRCFFVVPEFPIGTLGGVVAMVIALGVAMVRTRQKLP